MSQPHRRPRHRSVSRTIRLRRTVLGVVVLALVAVTTVRLVSREDATEVAAAAADRLPGVQATATAPAPPAPQASTPSQTPPPDSQDGSTTTEAPRRTEIAVPQDGTGKIRVVSVPGPQSTAQGREVRYTVEIEQGLGIDEAEVARTVRTVLLDKRGWQQEDGIRFVNVSPSEERAGSHVDIRVTLASPGLTDRLCAPLRTLSKVSCWNNGRSVLNLRRWMLGDDSYGEDVERYRIYQVNHEVGHGLGHQHQSCPGQGERAPIMVQQTLGLQGCKPWPYPVGA
ncbi:DUF3152 domain-containing protein [Knoellia sp. p5-6-4]|uniref:DUF3152 domain-containing protein n=1 Tax=unclassified Knoellia TaxID=2618719 RepID=UPI0023DAE798|nr:DUF3152 domain-containing protein [Knoellia sp. p5-6-4]MDF2143973.1 DUF3152 domain-containing protein [Knoellia sp. p5-6-4]